MEVTAKDDLNNMLKVTLCPCSKMMHCCVWCNHCGKSFRSVDTYWQGQWFDEYLQWAVMSHLSSDIPVTRESNHVRKMARFTHSGDV